MLSILIFFKNPIVEHRNGFGAVFLVVFWVFFNRFFKSNKKVVDLLLAAMLSAFPLSVLLAPHRFQGDVESLLEFFLSNFNAVHFDAWANFIGVIDFVEIKGYTLGEQIFSSLLFFVPRSLWEDKGVSSGLMLGDYLMGRYSMWFNNISLPFPAEGYMDFGVIGVMLFAILMALSSSFFDKCVLSKNKFLVFGGLLVGFSYIFILRGPFLPAFAFTSGGFIALTLLPRLLAKLFIYKRRS